MSTLPVTFADYRGQQQFLAHHSISYITKVAIDTVFVTWSVCLLVTIVYHTKMAEAI